jgi:hypothetical protein
MAQRLQYTHMISLIQVLNCIAETTCVDRTLILKAVTYEHLLRISGILTILVHNDEMNEQHLVPSKPTVYSRRSGRRDKTLALGGIITPVLMSKHSVLK